MTAPTIQENFNLTPYTTFGIAVKCRYFAEYSSVRELKAILRTPEYQQNETLHIGGGSNLLFTADYPGMVLHSLITGMQLYRKDAETAYVIAGAGEKWVDLVNFCVDHELAGLENLAYIPGEVGASAIQNVGAYGVEAKDCIFKVEAYDRLTHETREFTVEECRYGYRDSVFKREARGRYFILRVAFRLRPGTEARNLTYGPLKSLRERLGHDPDIREVRDEITRIRREKLPEPSETGSAGSFFKNPLVRKPYYDEWLSKQWPDMPHYPVAGNDFFVKIPAGWLIEHAGLKGARVGGAEVYPRQCLVLANAGGATGEDVRRLSDEVIHTVYRKYGVALSPEVNIITSQIEVKVLGTGTSRGVPEIGCRCNVCSSEDPRDDRQRASVLVKTSGLTLLIDASPDFRRQALDNEITQIDAVLLTHSHFDHVGGLDDLRPFCEKEDLPIYLRPDVASDLRKRLDYCFRESHYPGIPQFRLNEIANEPFRIRGVKITPISVFHAKLPIVGYRIGDFVYITDAKTVPEEEFEKLEGVDTLIVNSLRRTEHFSHFSLAESLAFIERVKPRQAYLTHLCHQMGTHEDTEKILPPNVHIAYDGMEIITRKVR